MFSGKADSAILLGFEYTINLYNLIKIVGAVLEKINFFLFFLCELPLILRVCQNRKKKPRHICKRTPDIGFERDRSIGLGSTIGDGQTDRQTDRQTDTQTHRHTHTFF